jgi:hypothetical protein
MAHAETPRFRRRCSFLRPRKRAFAPVARTTARAVAVAKVSRELLREESQIRMRDRVRNEVGTGTFRLGLDRLHELRARAREGREVLDIVRHHQLPAGDVPMKK